MSFQLSAVINRELLSGAILAFFRCSLRFYDWIDFVLKDHMIRMYFHNVQITQFATHRLFSHTNSISKHKNNKPSLEGMVFIFEIE